MAYSQCGVQINICTGIVNWSSVFHTSVGELFIAGDCRKDLKTFFNPMHELSRFIVEELTEALGLERDAFTRLESPNSNCTGRMNHYPVCTDPDAVLGIPGHADTQMLGILYQDDVGGLQVLKDGEWVGIKPDDSTFVVNIGDCFQVIITTKQ
jgi:isopenicillin N synthase-like dioxygenase